MRRFTGIWVPLATPFHDGALDRSALRKIVRHTVDAGVSGLVVCGSTGEAAALTEHEQLEALDTVMEEARDCAVVMGVAGNNMETLLRKLRQLESRSIAGLLVPPPYYIRPSQAGLVEYFRIVADAAPAPVIVYDIPYRTGVNLELDTLRTIAQHERVAALKDCGGNVNSTMNLIADCRLQVLAGEDQQILSTLCLGGSGAIAASAHIRPDLFVRVARLVEAGELAEARQAFYSLLPLIQLLFEEPNPGPLKAALGMMGWMRNELRAPMQPASPAMEEKLARELKRLACL